MRSRWRPNVAPRLFDLYRTGEINLDQLMALVVTDDHAAQERVWDSAQEWQEALLKKLPGVIRYSASFKQNIEELLSLPAPGRNRWDQGLTAAEMKRCRWVKPSMVCQVKFTEWTRDDRLRQAVFLGIRKDKNSNEVVREKAK
jgi:hypothetical protein